MIEGKIIAISGAHGTGKTHEVLLRAAALKRACPDMKIGVCQENVMRCPYPINKKTTQTAQQWIFSTQMAEELQMVSQYGLVVSDRSIVDAIAYTAVAGFDRLAGSMLQMAWHHLHNYRQIYFKTIKNNKDYFFSDGVRDAEDRDFQQSVEDMLFELYGLLGMNEKNGLVVA